MSEVTIDRTRAEVRGPRAAVLALAQEEPPGTEGLLAAGLAAVRAPDATWRLTGTGAELEAFADARAAALLVAVEPDAVLLRACGPSGLLGHFVRAVGLRPRPAPESEQPLAVPPARLAALLARRDTAGAGLSLEDAERLQPHVEALVAHWRLEVLRTRAGSGPAGWYLEVLDSELGLWFVEAEETAVRLVPATATAVLDELAALPGRVGLGAD